MLVACGHAASPRPRPDERAAARVDAAADAYVAAFVDAYPEDVDVLGLAEARHDRFRDRSPAATATWLATLDELDAATAGIDAASLFGEPAWVTIGYLREGIASHRARAICRNDLWAVDSLAGLHLVLVMLAQMQPVGDEARRRTALARWRTMPAVVDVEIANLREGLRLGYSAARSVVALVVTQLDGMLATSVEDFALRDPARRDPDLAAAFDPLVADALIPALRRYRDFLADEYAPQAREALGVAANPDGEACWRASFREQTSLDREPAETVRRGEARVAAFAAEARAIAIAELGATATEDLSARLAADVGDQLTDPDEMLRFARDAVARAHAAMPRVVLDVPADPVAVEPYPDYMGGGASARYVYGSDSGDRAAVYWLNPQQATTRGEAELIAFHEVWPGHHLQISTARHLPAAHRITQVVQVTAYVEGWGRYSEQLAEEVGLYTSPSGRIRRRLWPGRGMVVDPGIHLLGWTRAQAIDYMVAGGWTREFADGLVDRIAAWPAQLTAYDTGALQILELRDEAQARLGARFDLRVFNGCVLSAGAVTLTMLREVVARCLPR